MHRKQTVRSECEICLVNAEKDVERFVKNCYTKPFNADNYVDESLFLGELNSCDTYISENVTLEILFYGASVVVQQVTFVVIFLSISKYGVFVDSNVPTLAFLVIFLFGFASVLQQYTRSNSLWKGIHLMESIQSFLLTTIFLRITAPVLQTLTLSYSVDTIHALALVFSSLHLTFHDYCYVDGACRDGIFNGTISLNAAMFTAVLLASRFKNVKTVVTISFLAITVFTKFPSLARFVRLHSNLMYSLMSFLLVLLVCFLLNQLSVTLLYIYVTIVIITWIVCPIWLIYMQKFKDKKNGPWDIIIAP